MNRSRPSGRGFDGGGLRIGHVGRKWIVPFVLALAGLSALGLAPSSSPQPSASGLPSGSASPDASALPGGLAHPPALAYYYMWFNTASWAHAKTDIPVLGTYTSTSPAVIKQHVTWAKQAGLDAFIVSWKSTPALNLALSTLITECHNQGLKLVLIYEGLDVNRNPIPVSQVQSDLIWFENQYGSDPVFDLYGKPAVIWSGTWQFSDADISSVRTAVDAPNKVLLLGSERSAADYQKRAGLFDGDAYYWSSGDPLSTPGYLKRLTDLAATVHASRGLWLAPASTGYDGRLNGGTTVVDRRNGATLTAGWADAQATNPDGIALISWNEFTENSYVEPSRNFGERYLVVLALLTGAPGPVHNPTPSPDATAPLSPTAQASSSGPPVAAASGNSSHGRNSSNDLLASILVAALVLGGLVVVGYNLRSRSRQAQEGPSPNDLTGPEVRPDSLGRPIR
jgi:hypothetical protein